jgi:RNA polymerase sigma factor (sigma-70 family)
MTRRPLLRNGDFRASVLALCEQANVMPCDLFNARQLEGIETNSAECEVSDRALAAYAPAEIESPEDGYMRQEIAAQVAGLLAKLPERSQLAMRMHADGATLREIGEELGLCHERTRQVLEKAKRHIRRAVYRKPELRHLSDDKAST